MTKAIEMDDPNIKYWVGSESEEPMVIMFTTFAAEESRYRYIDGFNAAGARIASFKLENGEYTTDF